MNRSLPPPSCKNRSTMTAILTANGAEKFRLIIIRLCLPLLLIEIFQEPGSIPCLAMA